MQMIWGGCDNQKQVEKHREGRFEGVFNTVEQFLWMDYRWTFLTGHIPGYHWFKLHESWQNLSGFDCVAFTLLIARSQSIFSAQVRVEKWWSPKLKQLQSMPTRSLTPEFLSNGNDGCKRRFPGVTPWFPHWVHYRCWYRLRGELPAPEKKKLPALQHVSQTIAKIWKFVMLCVSLLV